LGGSKGPFKMTFAKAPPGGFASSYEKVQNENFAFLCPGDEELFVGGGALNGAVGKLLFEHAKQPIQFEKTRDNKYVTVKENGKDVPKFSKDTCPYKKTQMALFNKALKKKRTMVIAEQSEIGSLPVLFSGGRTYSDCKHPFGSVFIHIFKPENCPFGEQNCALLYTVGALGRNVKAPGEGVPDPARAAFVKNDAQDFLWEINQTGESTVQLVFEYNNHASKTGLPVIKVIRLPIVSGGVFIHPDVTPKDVALALIWGAHTGLAKNDGGLSIELMPGQPMEEAYADYQNKKTPGDWKDNKNVFGKINLQL